MNRKLRELRARKSALVDKARALLDIASTAGRDFDETETASFNDLKAQIETINKQIDAEQFILDQQAALGVDVPGTHVVVTDNRAADPQQIRFARFLTEQY